MKLSIITCTYNSKKYLQQTIDSVTAQNISTEIYEHIFIDGNSTDTTATIIESYQKKYPEHNIKILIKDPKGIYNAMNEGIKVARGEYLLFLHSDDYLEPNILIEYLKFIEKTGNKDMYYAKFNAVDEQGNHIYIAPSRNIYQKGLDKFTFGFLCYINQPAVLHKKELHDKYGYFNEKLKIIADREFRIVLARNKIHALFFNQIITNFRVHDQGMSNNPKIEKIRKQEKKYLRTTYYSRIESIIFTFVADVYDTVKKIKKKYYG